MSGPSIFRELRKRKVVQTAAIYGAVAWGVTEVVVTVTEQLFLPQWVSTLAVIGFVVGFPVAMFLAWTFDLTPEGLHRTEVGSRRGKASIVISLLLLIAGTGGLFFLIRPALQEHQPDVATITILPNSIAVMPFENTGFDPNDSWLSEGLSDELRDQLSRIQGVRVAARSSSVAARNQQLDALAASNRLGVANLVEGSLRRQGKRLRVSVQLVEGATGLTLWSETYERGPNELVNVQQAIAEQVVHYVLPEAEPVMAEPATRDATANELMLLARHYEQKVRDRSVVDVETLLEAVRLYREATEADPNSALAHSRLAGALLYLGDLEAAEAPIFRALTLDPDLSEVQNTLGLFYWARGMPGAAEAFARAVELNPNHVDALINHATTTWFSHQRPKDIHFLYERALELDPLSLERHRTIGDFYGKRGQPDRVRNVIRDIEDRFDGTESYRAIAWLYRLIGEIDHSIAWTLRARDREPGNPDHLAGLAELYAITGDFDTALELEPEPGVGLLYRMRRYPELIDSAEFLMIEVPEDIDLRYLLSFAYVANGQYESAIHVLSASGQPDVVINDLVRSVSDIEGLYTLINALAAIGESDTAGALAEWSDRATWDQEDKDWWFPVHRACGLAVMGRHEEALGYLAQVNESPRMLWDPVIRDIWCLQRYVDEPVYQDIIRHHEDRQARLRARLPETLATYGVEL